MTRDLPFTPGHGNQSFDRENFGSLQPDMKRKLAHEKLQTSKSVHAMFRDVANGIMTSRPSHASLSQNQSRGEASGHQSLKKVGA